MAGRVAKSPVSRKRRAWFTFCTVGACITMAFSLAIRDVDTKVAQIVADGLISLAMWLSIAYVGASSVDYSSVLSRFAPDASKRAAVQIDADEDDEPERRRRSRDHTPDVPFDRPTTGG